MSDDAKAVRVSLDETGASWLKRLRVSSGKSRWVNVVELQLVQAESLLLSDQTASTVGAEPSQK